MLANTHVMYFHCASVEEKIEKLDELEIYLLQYIHRNVPKKLGGVER